MPAPTQIGTEFDFLAKRDKFFHHPPTKKACVLATVRNEGLGLLEWVAHYRVIGFDTIFVYSNENSDASEDLLSALAHSDIIHLCWNIVAPPLVPQIKAYRHAFWCDPNFAQHEWAYPLDADEFFIPCLDGAPVANVGDWFGVIEQRHAPSAISLNWKWFSGNGDFEKTDGLCMERFRMAKAREHIKTAFKLREAADIVNPHIPLLFPEAKQIDGNGEAIANRPTECAPALRYGQVNHYWNKSFEEFFLRKHRGGGTGERREYSQFFKWGRLRPDVPEPLPTAAFLEEVKDEMARLRGLPGVDAAEQKTHARFREMMREHGGARAAYETTLRELSAGS